MRLHSLLILLRKLAPEPLAEPWDHVGLQIGDPDWPVRRAHLCIDLTEPVLDEAIRERANLIVSYHPPIFKPMEALTTLDLKQRLILRAAGKKIAIYSPHTALDAAVGGVNDWLCQAFGVGSVRPIAPIDPNRTDAQYKLVTFVPLEHADAVRASLAAAGAGQIGDYSLCSFGVEGEGTFRGSNSTRPAVGRAGRFERVRELRLEMICPGNRLAQAVGALRQAHPYEEPALDIYPLAPIPRPHVSDPDVVGLGRVMTLAAPLPMADLIRRIKRHLGIKHLEVAQPPGFTAARTVGLCAGAGGSLLEQAGDIDLFFTGEMRHHDVLAAVGRGIAVVLAGHTQTERPYLPVYQNRLEELTGPKVQWQVSIADIPPSTIV